MEVFTKEGVVFENLFALGPGGFLMLSAKDEELPAMEASLRELGGDVPHPEFVPYGQLERVWYDEKDLVLQLRTGKGKKQKTYVFGFATEADRTAAMRILKDNLGPGFVEKRKIYSGIGATLKPLGFTLLIAAFTYIAYRGAEQVANGETADTSGRNALVKKIFYGLMQVLGPTGVLILGGLVIAGCLWWVYARFSKPPILVTLTRD